MFVWDVAPTYMQLGPIPLRWYGTFLASGMLVVFVYLLRLFRKEGYPEASAEFLGIYLIIGLVVGLRLGHCFFYAPGHYLTHPWKIFMIWKGGLASHGGIIGILLAIYLYVRKRPWITFWNLADILTVPTMFIAGLARLGNFFNSETSLSG